MRLGPGARILEHCDDMGAGTRHAELRIHIPVQTGSGVAFWVDHQLVLMRAGETWYADFGLPHRVGNNSGADRVHLVPDCEPSACPCSNGWASAPALPKPKRRVWRPSRP